MNTHGLRVHSSVEIGEDCPLHFTVTGANELRIHCGTPSDGFDLTFDSEALRTFTRLAQDALERMDALYADESGQ